MVLERWPDSPVLGPTLLPKGRMCQVRMPGPLQELEPELELVLMPVREL